MSIKHLDNEQGHRNNDNNNRSFSDTLCEQEKSEKHLFMLGIFLRLCVIILQPLHYIANILFFRTLLPLRWLS